MISKTLKIALGYFFKFLKITNFNFDSFTRFYLRFLFNEKKINQRWVTKNPFTDDLNLYLDYVPDRYSLNYHEYKKHNNFFSYGDTEKWIYENYNNNIGDLTRYFFLNLCFDILNKENIIGNVSELGVFKGNSAFLLSKYARMVNTVCYLFDTFESFDERDLDGSDARVPQSVFNETSLEKVKNLVEEENTIFVKGYFPDSLALIPEIDNFALVHIDCDLEKPFVAALDYFYPKLLKGGFLIMHDYTSLCWPGAEKAIDDFFKDKPEFIVPIPDKSGTCVIRKV